MAAHLSWVDYSCAHKEDMDWLLDAFRDEGTMDELRIGTMRDTFTALAIRLNSDWPDSASVQTRRHQAPVPRIHQPGDFDL